ncbi:ethanolamine utilization protein EutJ [Rhodospirillum rubrum]|uniref:Ethanolamine utilization protein eutJ n=1 Tax=Rhodospirillum rubrum (strain ATCC 11170 / ATH 1.1.1 / DSM 467 / LMG 4362 / NCIMB 8255 / S1) TaxID=269796 RepID=Q2RVY4_RHORT|nr:ethanolamine utilization protein EutJ [Rhodospirillum rubrum]ABC21711.1 ethanolamine utilization protein eutJ [Rhodospirillum rubrum ATCC 11170]AEO47409.1 ethanolamine utilization protein EutJ [Rhodospirillum rubrum F11]MBK5953264.1 ethanolamine utilization protein EutJ [Rhodospirillum rubrum]QXG81373.1 ethanolamine utilization protein EutJ [Rhodospirillum rubrum]HAQ01204.1 ethanolamine utilization protein EutJ [Rhodospirillum rubrum]
MNHTSADTTLRAFAQLIAEGTCLPAEERAPGPLKTGVDLGTANIVLSVVDANNRPVTGAMFPSTVVRDGIVVDYVGAVSVVRRLKAELEDRLGCPLTFAGTAIPPGILAGNVKAIANVVEAAGFEVADVSDEPTAASRVLGLREGAVVDVGGGTTGISILKNGEVVFTDDEATGGTHMTLVLAGAHGVSFEEAEAMKKDTAAARDVFAVVQPVVEKMASIVKRCLKGYDVETVYVVGGACTFDQFEQVFRKEIGLTIVKPAEPLLVTPLGIAMYGATPGEGAL